MGTTSSAVESARIDALLSRLDPEPAGACEVAGCIHLHRGGHAGVAEAVPILAA